MADAAQNADPLVDSDSAAAAGLGRAHTLKKRNSVSRRSSLVKRSASNKSLRNSPVVAHPDYNSPSYTPIPTQGTPTDVLAERFQAWRTFLKSLIAYFRELQASYEARSKAIVKVSNVISNTSHSMAFMSDGGLTDAARHLTDFHKRAVAEATKSKEIEEDVIQALQGLRADLAAKIKEIKGLHGDFRNSVEKEKDGTSKAIAALDHALQRYDRNDEHDVARNDPFIVRLGVDRAVERQIDEENYLHRAYLNLESSGRELESIVVGEIQKAYNALAGILKREADDAYSIVESLRTGPIAMRKDFEWSRFVTSDPHFVNPDLPLRKASDIDYPGKSHPATTEIRAGMMERKSKYLKSYSPGWYILSPTHLHEFKSAENFYSQPPIMSLYLADQKLGTHSNPDSSSHKFMLKGRQSGGVHRGHAWVFRAESHNTMMAWYDAIKMLTEKTAAERNAYVRQHAQSASIGSQRLSVSSDGLEEDEADKVPYSASVEGISPPVTSESPKPQRPLPGGRFPSDIAVPNTGLAESDSSDIDTTGTRSHVKDLDRATPSVVVTSKAMERLDNDPYRLNRDPSDSSAYPVSPFADFDQSDFHETMGEDATAKQNVAQLTNASGAPVDKTYPTVAAIAATKEEPPVSSTTASNPVVLPAVHRNAMPYREQPMEPSADRGGGDRGISSNGPNTLDTISRFGDMLSPSNAIAPGGVPVSATSAGNSSWMASPDSQVAFGESGMADGTTTGLKRTQTEHSISALHVPGEFPHQPGSAGVKSPPDQDQPPKVE